MNCECVPLLTLEINYQIIEPDRVDVAAVVDEMKHLLFS